jgi:hypothetical protein
VLQKNPLKFAQVRLYRSSGNTTFNGTTDQNGRFAATKMPPDNYRLEVTGWGTTTVQLNPDLDKTSKGRIPTWDLILIDHACVVTLMEWN